MDSFFRAIEDTLSVQAPHFIWVVAILLIIGTFVGIFRLWRNVSSLTRTFDAASNKLHELFSSKLDSSQSTPSGLTANEVKSLASFFEDASQPRSIRDAWIDYRPQLVKRTSINSGEEFWSASGAEKSFSESTLLSGQFNHEKFKALPGILTGVGLLFTFIAILVALSGVKVADGQVSGVDLLISGLSGKFLSSIVALFCATTFVMVEKWQFHKLQVSHVRLSSTLDRIIPQLSATQVLVDISGSISQLNSDTSERFVGLKNEFGAMGKNVESLNVSVQDLGTSLVPILIQGVGESVNPTINKMVETIEELNKFLRRAEENRNNQLSETVTGLLSQLKEDLSKVFGEMSGNFKESLTGSTHGQFENVSQTLGQTASLLGSMNSQFESSQSALQHVMSDVSITMQQLMTGLSSQVEHLGRQMSDTVRENSQNAVSAAQGVVTQVNELSAANEQRLEQLLAIHDTQLTRVEETSASLAGVIGEFNRLVAGLRQTSETSAASVAGITTAATLIGEAATRASGVHQQLQLISERVKESQEHQETVWRGISDNLGNYQNLFKQTEGSATSLLGQIGTNLTNYQEVTQNGFNGLVQAADQHFTNAVQRLKGTVDELGDVLEDLTEQLEKMKSNGNRN
jgi:ABC-type transporter Mla subunit MlaD